MNRSTDRQMLIGMGAVAAVIGVSALIGYHNVRQLYLDAHRVTQTHETLTALDDLLSTIKEAESGQRGYLITGDERFLSPYEHAVAVADARIENIRALTAEHERQQARIPRLRELVKMKLDELSHTVALRRERDFDSVRQEVLQHLDKPKLDSVRAFIAEMRQEEQDLRRQRQAAKERAYLVSVVARVITAGVALGTLLVFLWFLRRHLQDRRQAAADLHDQREWFRTTLGSIGDAVIATDTKGRVTFLNPIAEELTGWTQAAAAGRPLTDVFHIVNEETRAVVEDPAARALREGCVVGLANHTILIARDGTERPIDDSASPIRNAQGEVSGVVLVFRDVAERRRAERTMREQAAKLKEEREWLHVTLRSIGDAVMTTDDRGRVTFLNPIAESLTGWGDDEALGQSSDCVFHIVNEETRETVESPITRVLREGRIVGLANHTMLIAKDGSERPIDDSASPICDDTGRIAGVVLVFRDVTARRQADADRERLAAIVEGSHDAVIGKDLNGMVTSWNTGAEQIFGYTAEEMLGRPISLLVPEGRADEMPRILERIKRGEEIENFDTIRRRKDGTEILISLTCSPIRGSGGRIIGVSKIARDVTERNRLFQALEDRSDQLAEADRRKNEFLATLSHELRNPLAALSHALELLGRTGQPPEVVGEMRRLMERQLVQIVRLVDDLLDVSRITSGKISLRKARVELGEVVRSAVELSRTFIEQGAHDLEVALPSHPVHFDADPARLAQILSNLLNNAAKYTDKGGRIRLSAERMGSEVAISVRDSGIGIAPEHLPRVFEMFSQAAPALERAQGGLGVGLALVRGLIELHGGTVEARSAGLGHGSEFVVHLPISVGPMPPVKTVARPAESVAATSLVSKCRILVVDDNRDSAYWLQKLLRIDGHDAQIAHDGEEAIQTAEAFQPEVVLLDIGLPRMNGYDAAMHIRRQPWGGKMALIALTGWGQEDDKRRAREAGFDHHLTKPVEPAVLNQLLAKFSAKTSASMAASGAGVRPMLPDSAVHRPA
ncbi:MAG TPA: PAS domain S-box protein [Phycisphaerae bacterium]|nr:PAS domain S-box protein [Phycisphaerae bacterium]